MKEFLKYTLATITGLIIASILFFIVMLASLSAMVSAGNKPVSISTNSILVLKAGMPVPDRGEETPFGGFDLVNLTFTATPGLNEILNNIRKATDDSNIKGILIENGLNSAGWATTEEIRRALLKFRESGKFVISYTDYITTQECYYLATSADKIYVNPGSMVDFKGLSSEVIFFKKALEKLGIDVQVTRHGKFKGAVEPFILDKLSEENKAQIKDYTGSIWNKIVTDISESRNISPEELNRIADNLDGNLASGALEKKLVDGLLYRDQLIDTLKSLVRITHEKDLNLVSMTKYSKVPDNKMNYSSRKRIAVIYASGTIVAGKGREGDIGGTHYADVIRKVRLDTSVKAVVVRVNSPGGSATASDIIWRELELTAKEKPVVISMGNYAASGGYYISATGTKIYADHMTISGSIGVFGLIPNANKLLEQKLGLSTEILNTNKNSDFPSVTRPMNTYEKELMQMSIEKIYGDFLSRVASGRNMSTQAIDSIGQGRVWSGASARNIGLVDEMGGLKDAIEGAANLAGLSNYSLRELPELEDPYMRIISQLGGEIRMNILKNQLGESMKYYNIVQDIKNLSGIQARLPYLIEIR
jgi:protease-4